MSEYVGCAEAYFSRLGMVLGKMSRDAIDNGVAVIAEAWKEGRQIITLGNGGSAMTAQHFITDWNKSIYLASGKQFRGRTLSDNIGLLTAYANDISYDDIFLEQLKNILQPGDLVIAISGSGNSENVIRGVQYANENDATTLGLCGYRGGKLKNLARHVVWADVDDMQLCEDVHAIFGHIVMQTLCKIIKKS